MNDLYDIIEEYERDDGLPGNEITSIEVDKERHVWIGTYREGLSVFDGVDWITYNKQNSELRSDDVHCIRKDRAC